MFPWKTISRKNTTDGVGRIHPIKLASLVFTQVPFISKALKSSYIFFLKPAFIIKDITKAITPIKAMLPPGLKSHRYEETSPP